MMHFHIAFTLGLIALTLGTALFVWAKHIEGCESKFAKIVGMLVVILSVASLFCTVFSGVTRGLYHGYGALPSMQMGQMMHSKTMMNNAGMSDSGTPGTSGMNSGVNHH